MNIMDKIISLDKEQVLDLLFSYNDYVIEICDRNDGSVPVCIEEYYENDYEMRKVYE